MFTRWRGADAAPRRRGSRSLLPHVPRMCRLMMPHGPAGEHLTWRGRRQAKVDTRRWSSSTIVRTWASEKPTSRCRLGVISSNGCCDSRVGGWRDAGEHEGHHVADEVERLVGLLEYGWFSQAR
jgi:hypothetical protein